MLIDGRSVYTPLYAGVYWDVQNVPLQDVDRIEVHSRTRRNDLGTNAVDGVINIITKKRNGHTRRLTRRSAAEMWTKEPARSDTAARSARA